MKDPVANKSALDYLGTIEGGLRFTDSISHIENDLSVIAIAESSRTWDFKLRPNFEPKSICFLIEPSSNRIIDKVMDVGEFSCVVWANLRERPFQEYALFVSDAGEEIQYAFDRNGFRKIGADDLLTQEIVHAKAWLAILQTKSGTPSEIEETRRALRELNDGVRKKFRVD